MNGAIRKLFGTISDSVTTLVHTFEQPSSKILNLYGTKELGIGATMCSGVRVPNFSLHLLASAGHRCEM